MSGEHYSFMKAMHGSLRDGVPSQEELGAFLVNHVDRTAGSDSWDKIMGRAAQNSWNPFAVSAAMKKETGRSAADNFPRPCRNWGDVEGRFGGDRLQPAHCIERRNQESLHRLLSTGLPKRRQRAGAEDRAGHLSAGSGSPAAGRKRTAGVAAGAYGECQQSYIGGERKAWCGTNTCRTSDGAWILPDPDSRSGHRPHAVAHAPHPLHESGAVAGWLPGGRSRVSARSPLLAGAF